MVPRVPEETVWSKHEDPWKQACLPAGRPSAEDQQTIFG
jgi:hypothetical protein